ncbi:alpha/beta fold hydrolase [Paenibacillus yanchengensis]|uniref:Alpha/beta fold hydrolase n=1 Tax=Paenibacillus yanchengensis TaxID=2035833 RepID=A0ABW4YIS8_9BACL
MNLKQFEFVTFQNDDKLIEKLNIDNIVIFGHSLGGYVALAFAEKYEHKLLGLGLILSTALPDTEEKKQKRRQDIDAISVRGTQSYVRKLIPKLFAASNMEKMKTEISTLIEVGLRMNAEGMRGILEGMQLRPNRSHVLANASYPILLVAGAEDQIVSPTETFSVAPEELTYSTFHYPHIL